MKKIILFWLPFGFVVRVFFVALQIIGACFIVHEFITTHPKWVKKIVWLHIFWFLASSNLYFLTKGFTFGALGEAPAFILCFFFFFCVPALFFLVCLLVRKKLI